VMVQESYTEWRGCSVEKGKVRCLFDPDIYTDGRISVQGIDAVLFPPVEDTAKSGGASPVRKAPAVTGTAKPKLRRGQYSNLCYSH
uniref:Uncharacterized protein n=1 Tax=Aegilops tauschii subsp. strangulata TaxID=200361 RepID=A0A453BM86_AEGTS